jgi:hypothetical protein
LKKNTSGSSETPTFRHAQPAGLLHFARRAVVFRAELLLCEVELPRLQAEQFGVLVGHDPQHQAIEVRQRDAAIVLPPVVWIPREREPLPRLVLA